MALFGLIVQIVVYAKRALKAFSSVRYKYDANKKIINKEFSNSDIDKF